MSAGVWILVFVLILANAFYVAAEFGAVGVRRSRVRRMSEDGHLGARLLLPFVQQPADLTRYVAASQVGITVSSLVLGAVGQGIAAVAVAPYLASWFGFDSRAAATVAAAVVLILLTAVQVVIGELVPKSIALRYPTEVALATVLPMRWSLTAFKPLIAILNGTATSLLRLFGVSLSGHRHLHSPDEIALLFAESRDGGLLEPDEQQRLHKALRLSRQTAHDMMVPRDRLTMVDAAAPWLEALQTAAATPFSRLPVYRGSRDQIVGMLRVKDLVQQYVHEGPPPSIAPLIRAVVKVPHDLPGDQVIARLRAKRAHQAAVVDADGTIAGFVTIQDVLAEFLGPEGQAIVTTLVIIVVFLTINALFVGAEFALIGVSRTAVESRAGKGDLLARRVLEVLTSSDAQDRFIATAQFGITIASLGLGMYAEHAVAAWLEPRLDLPAIARLITAHSLASILAVSALTYVHILFGETIPKAVALAASEQTARVLYWPMRAVMLVFFPFVWLLNGTGNAVLRLLRIPQHAGTSDQVYSPEELQIIVEESAHGGALRAESGLLLRELLVFGDLTAGEAMVPRVRVVGIPIGATPDMVRRVLRTHHHARYPMYEGDLDHIVGMMHVKDLLKRLLANEKVSAGDVKPMPVLPVSSKLDAVLETMQRSQAHIAIVIDEHGGTAGVISLEDLFEEVVGEIDEDLSATPPISQAADGSTLVAGTVRLDELGQRFDLDLAHEEVDSVSGLILALLGRPPVAGDSVVYGRVKLDVTATTGRGVRQARATLLPE